MKTELKTALIMGVVVVGAIVGAATYFSTLENPKEIKQNQLNEKAPAEPVGQTPSTQVEKKSIVPLIDKSHFKKAPDLIGITGYVNTSPEELKANMKDKVVLYDFWTYSCINCIRTLPYLTAWNEKYADKGLLIIGVHSPEFEFEKDINNVKMAVEKYGIKYPVVLDSNMQTWNAFDNRYWPRHYLTDSEGYIRHDHIGEGGYAETEKQIQGLLEERSKILGINVAAAQPLVNLEEPTFMESQTPELYFGYKFVLGRNYLGNPEGFKPEQSVTYVLPKDLQRDNFYLEGKWLNLEDRMRLELESGKIVLPYYAKAVNIVAANNSDLQILLDGVSVDPKDSGTDVKDGKMHVSEDRLYNIITSSQAGMHTLTILAKPGFEIYTFTFG